MIGGFRTSKAALPLGCARMFIGRGVTRVAKSAHTPASVLPGINGRSTICLCVVRG